MTTGKKNDGSILKMKGGKELRGLDNSKDSAGATVYELEAVKEPEPAALEAQRQLAALDDEEKELQ